MSPLEFAPNKPVISPRGSWKILIVDDDPGIHSITKTVLRDLLYNNKTLNFLSAYNNAEAESLLIANNDISLVILDVVMDEDDSGLKLVEYIRNELGNSLVRIILRTGHPGMAPAQQVIIDYDINDYEVKTDLTALKLYTVVLASLRNYNDLIALNRTRANRLRYRAGLTRISEASSMLFSAVSAEELVSGIYNELQGLLGANIHLPMSSFAALQDDSDFRVILADGSFIETTGSQAVDLIGEAVFLSLQELNKEHRNLLVHEGSLSLYEDTRGFRILIHFAGISNIELQERQLIEIFASNVSVAFENLRLNREIAGTQVELITRLSEVVETRSHDTAQHVRRVGLFCELIAEKLGLEDHHIQELKLASTMHDIGKIGIPDEILLKPDVLTEEEFSTIKAHTGIGHTLLKGSSRPLLIIASGICLEHHERFDGTGYPNGIKGVEIHINSRIVSICDVFDSITHGRLHRDPWDTKKAADYLLSEKGKAFDPQIVDVFLDNLDSVIQINHDFPD